MDLEKFKRKIEKDGESGLRKTSKFSQVGAFLKNYLTPSHPKWESSSKKDFSPKISLFHKYPFEELLQEVFFKSIT